VGWTVRNATRPVFPEGNGLKKKKNQKEKRPVETAATMEIREKRADSQQLLG